MAYLSRIFLSVLLILSSSVYADQPRSSSAPLQVKSADGTVVTYPYSLSVTNGTLTNNGDGTASLTTGGGGGVAAGGLNAVQYNSPVGTFAGTETVFSFNGTNVGVGTTNGTAILDVRGNELISGNIGVGGATATKALNVTGDAAISSTLALGATAAVANSTLEVKGTGALTYMLNATSSGAFHTCISEGGASPANTFFIGQGNNCGSASAISIDPNRNVGIGIVTPKSLFAINAGTSIGSPYAGTNTAPTNGLIVVGNVGIGTFEPRQALEIIGGVTTNFNGYGFFGLSGVSQGMSSSGSTTNINAGGSGAIIALQDNSGSRYMTLINGNVGIGTTTPQGGLVVTNGNVGVGTFAPISLFDVNRSFNVLSNGRVGIGTWAPPSIGLALSTAASIGGLFASSNPNVAQLQISNTSTGGRIWTMESGGQTQLAYHVPTGHFGIIDGTLGSNRFDIDTAGNVGIGTMTPQGGLVVMNGNVGIGTWAPGDALDVKSSMRLSVSSGDGFRIVNSDTNKWTMFGLGASNYLFTADTTNLRLGVGTGVYPGSKLSVGGNAIIGSAYYTLVGPTNGLAVEGNVGIGTTTPQGGLVVMNGNVGIGTWVPSATLAVAGGLNLRASTGSSDPVISFGSAGTGASTILSSNVSLQTSLGSYGVTINGANVGTGVQIYQSGSVAWGAGNSAPDVYLTREAAAVLGQSAVANAQTYRLYETRTDASNYSRFSMAATSGGPITFASEAAGTGTARNFSFTGGNVGIGTTITTSRLTIGTSQLMKKVVAANTACNTTCGSVACYFGTDTAIIGTLVDCTDATADICFCSQ